jgi:eukaryotic-like serine/threonine-protein kinase
MNEGFDSMRRQADLVDEGATADRVVERDATRCSFCGELAAEGLPAADCPFLGETGCPLGVDASPHEDDPLAETIAYHGAPAAPDDDGFPAVDNLIDGLLGQYRIGAVIGQGAMGRVYRGEHTGLGRTSAIKVLSPGLMARSPQTVERFSAEARAVAGLIHPNVVTVHNLGFDRGYHYIEMEYIAGGVSLREKLIREGAFEAMRATTLVRQVALALGAAHRSGLVHRDVKPANVLLASDGQAKLADFGLVRRVDDRQGAALAGTPTFMAPELFQGATADPRTDLYAVGVMWFYLMTARLPFAADRLADLIRLHKHAPPPDLRRLAPEVPDELPPILGRLLAKDPKNRPESADAFADELKAVLGHLRDTESLVRESLDDLDCLVQGAKDRYRVIVPVPGDRIQEVYLEVAQGRKHERLLQIFSVCAPADPRHYEFALKLNAELTIGGLSVREVNGQSMFVMTRTYSRAHVTTADIRAAVIEIARKGDWVEQQLTATDVF